MNNTIKNIIYNIILLTLSILIGVTIVEFSLRVFYPRYIYSAESSYDIDQNRIWIRQKNSNYVRKHPDSGKTHSVFHNNFASRQHRIFSKTDILSGINIGFFGDSFTENLRLPTEHSFTEPLDFLLNTRIENVNVLNFGVDGYGTDQSYLSYQNFKYINNLDYVFYVFCDNDIWNICKNNIFYINNSQELVHVPCETSPWWIRFLGKFHTTYLILDIFDKRGLIHSKVSNSEQFEYRYLKRVRDNRFYNQRDDYEGQILFSGLNSEEHERCIKIFNELIRRWKKQVEENGGKFYVVLLPRLDEHNVRHIFSDDLTVLNLYDKFNGKHKSYEYKDWKFINDSHWNEAANKEAAFFLYRFLEDELNLTPISDELLNNKIYNYYSSFDGWQSSESFDIDVTILNKNTQNIRSKYNELDMKTRLK